MVICLGSHRIILHNSQNLDLTSLPDFYCLDVIAWPTDRLIDWLVDWLTYWLIAFFRLNTPHKIKYNQITSNLNKSDKINQSQVKSDSYYPRYDFSVDSKNDHQSSAKTSLAYSYSRFSGRNDRKKWHVPWFKSFIPKCTGKSIKHLTEY